MVIKKEQRKLILGIVGLLLLSSGISWGIFSFLKSSPATSSTNTQTNGKKSKINLSLPKNSECPINGQKFTKQEEDIWLGRRPIAASIENHLDSRPQSGLSRADVMYEFVAEGGITRFLAIFYCNASAEDLRIGPVRSARVYAINFAAEYQNPLFIHVGGANNICRECPGGIKPVGTVAKDVDAFRLLNDLGWRGAVGNAMDGGTNIGYPAMWRDPERIPGAATEHTYMGSTDKLFEEGKKRGFGYKDSTGTPWNEDFTKWKFADDKALSSPIASKISFEFWSNKPDYDVMWQYSKESNSYMRFTGGKEHKDMDTNEQLSAKNIVIMFADERGPVDKEGHMFYKNLGTGKGMLFQNGDVKTITWSKALRENRVKFFDDKGVEISMVRGVTWIELVPTGNKIEYN